MRSKNVLNTSSCLRLIVIFAFLILLISALDIPIQGATAGRLDPTFNAGVYQQFGSAIQTVVTQPDGKILIGGDFEVVGGLLRGGIARLHPDGTVDESFNPPYLIDGDKAVKIVNAIGIQSDGKIIVGGTFNWLVTHPIPPIVRLNTDGSLDTTFNNFQINGSIGGYINVVDVRPDDKILIGGNFTFYSPEERRNLMRLNADGSADNTFITGDPHSYLVEDIAVQPDGRILGFNRFTPAGRHLQRLLRNGTHDPSFSAFVNSNTNVVKVYPDGKILIGGDFTQANNIPRNGIARLDRNGLLDETFVVGINYPITISDIEFGSDGKILIAGTFNNSGGSQRKLLARLNKDGSVDSSFNLNTEATRTLYRKVSNIAPLPNGQILITGAASWSPLFSGAAINRINPDGNADNSFKSYVGSRGLVDDIALLPNGQIVIGGQFSAVNTTLRPGIARLNPDGAVDTTFNPVITDMSSAPYVTAVAAQPDNKILIGGGFIGTLARLKPDGSTDTIFNTNQSFSTVEDIAVLPDGKIIAAGDLWQGGYFPRVVKFNQDGSVDNSFRFPAATGRGVKKVFVQPDGKILICGNFSSIGGVTRYDFARLNADGSLDTLFYNPTYNPSNFANRNVYDIAQLRDGKVLIAGNFGGFFSQFQYRSGIVRLKADGSLDTSFDAMPYGAVTAFKVQPTNGKILVGGSFTSIGGPSVPRRGITRLNPNGSIDLSFIVGAGTAGYGFYTDDGVYAMELDASGKILAGGAFIRYDLTLRLGIVRLLNNTAAGVMPFDYDGDEKADLSVFRPSAGFWYIRRSTAASSQNFDAVQFGAAGDLIVPADYDGDRKADIAVWRPSDGVWYLLQSTAGFRAAQFGQSGDIPVPGDFDGDGKANLAVFRPSTGSWYIARASGTPSQNFDAVAFGAKGDKPIAGADFDGDGKSDVAVFRPSTGDWYRIESTNNQFVRINFGIAEDKPVPADFDGDGKTDIAVWRPSNGTWYHINGGAGTLASTQFGLSQDSPVAADYDGDGKADLAVFRPSEGSWYMLQSALGFSIWRLGANGDIPTPNSYVR